MSLMSFVWYIATGIMGGLTTLNTMNLIHHPHQSFIAFTTGVGGACMIVCIGKAIKE